MGEIGERIKNLRKNNGLNQSQFCEMINLAQSRLSEIESNKTKPSYDTLVSIKENFNISLDWLITGSIYEDGYSTNTSQPELEKELIQGFRELSDRDKREVIAYIKLKKDLSRGNPVPPSSTLKNGRLTTEEAVTSEIA
jgi:transcriptional regulator with XRE-family HTH domain